MTQIVLSLCTPCWMEEMKECEELPKFFEVKINERTWQLPGEFVCMFSLTRLAKGESYNDLHLKFGSNRDFMGSFFFVFVRHIYCHFFHKISGRSMEI